MGKYNSRKRKTKKNIPAGEVHIHSTFNNTIVTITDLEGNVVSWASAGTQGVKGSKNQLHLQLVWLLKLLVEKQLLLE